MRKSSNIATCIILLLLGCSLAQAEVYMWTDAQGVKHFSETPPTPDQYNRGKGSAPKALGAEHPGKSRSTPKRQTRVQHVITADVLLPLHYTDQKSLRTIGQAVYPAVKAGNVVAINICRQTMYALGDDVGLFRLPLRAARELSQEVIDSWVETVRLKADSGDPFFKTVLGALYYNGHGVPSYPDMALRLWKEAATLGYHDAFCKLGSFSALGIGGSPNVAAALKYYQQAADKGSVYALYQLGTLYFDGNFVPHDYGKAAVYFQKAVEMNFSAAFVSLGICYFNGLGVPADKAHGIELLQKAFELNNPNAVTMLNQFGVLLSKKELAAYNEGLTPIGGAYDMPQTFPSVEIVTQGMGTTFQTIRSCEMSELKRELSTDPYKLYVGENNGWTALTLAIASGCTNMVKYMVNELKVDVNLKHHTLGFSPLHIATLTGQKELVEFLLDHGASMSDFATEHEDYWYSRIIGTPLHTAIHNEQYDILELLTSRGGDYATEKNADGETVWDLATKYGKKEMISNILRKHDKPIPEYKMTIGELNTAIGECTLGKQRDQQRQGELVHKMIVDHPELLHAADEDGNTSLNYIAGYCLNKTLVFLLDQGADIHATNDRGAPPLHRAITHLDKMKILMEHGAEVNAADKSGNTVLHLLARFPDNANTIEMIEYLISQGAIKEVRNFYDMTPFDIAISQKRSTKIAQALKP